MNCYKVSNNKYADCPARMSDARHFTNYGPNCETELQLAASLNLKNAVEYKEWLTNNGTTLMNEYRKIACVRNCCNNCGGGEYNGTMLPEKYIVKYDENGTYSRVLNDPNGVGDGRQYYTDANKINCNVNPNNCNGFEKNICAKENVSQMYEYSMLDGQRPARYAYPRGY